MELDEVTEYDVCNMEANNYDRLVRIFIGMHVVCLISTIFREFFDAEIGLLGQMMRMVIPLCVPFYLYCLLMAHEHLSLIMVRNEADRLKGVFDPPSELDTCRKAKTRPTYFLCDKCPRPNYDAFSGRAFEFFFIEIMVFFFYMLSMMWYMLKSRFDRVGEEVEKQFEPV